MALFFGFRTVPPPKGERSSEPRSFFKEALRTHHITSPHPQPIHNGTPSETYTIAAYSYCCHQSLSVVLFWTVLDYSTVQYLQPVTKVGRFICSKAASKTRSQWQRAVITTDPVPISHSRHQTPGYNKTHPDPARGAFYLLSRGCVTDHATGVRLSSKATEYQSWDVIRGRTPSASE